MNTKSNERIMQAVKALQEGKGILLVDNADRENEGDLIFPAETMTVSDMALMIRECSGIVCLCLPPKKADKLGLQPMVIHNTSHYGTNFTISIEAAQGVTTGVSASDRIATIRTAISPEAKPEHLAFPGHVFPLIAKENGKYQLDLWKANEIVLLDAGVLQEHLEITDICTCCNPDLLFSHRASHGKRGNLGAFLCLK